MDNCTLDGIMFTAKLVLLSLVLFSAKVSSESYLAKCCPPGQIFSGHATVKCVSVPSSKIELVFQWNATAEFQGLPRCDEPEDITTTPLDDFNSSEFLEVPACLEILHEQITGESIVIVVHCRSNKDRQVKAINTFFPQLAYVKKCCPHGTIFDRRTKACVPQLSKSDSLVIFLQNGSADADLVIIATEAGWPCNGPIIDYEIDEDDIFLRNGTYSVMVPILKNNLVVKEEVFVTENSACLDTTLGSVSNRRLLARVCRNPEFCDGNACIRKCCAEGEFFYANGCSQLAPKEPKEFYQALTSAVNQTKLSAFNMSKEYGVLIGKTCKYGMYPVDPKEEEWWLTSEGHVIADGDEIYDQNNYCMDIFYNKSESDHAFHLFICFDAPAPQEQDSVRGLRGSTITKAHGHRKRFLLYCLYAFGFSLLVSSLAIVADSTDILPYYLQPDIGYTSCWFTQQPSSYGEMTFFIGPVTIQLISNMAFFILTSVHCNKVKAEIKRVTTDPMDPRSKRFHSDRSRFVMNIKLFTVMGISWIFEVVSFFLKKYVNYWHDAFFYASDVFNCLQGVLIFILFVLKLRVYNALRRRLGLDTKKKSTPTCNATTILQDPYKVRKSVSSNTLTTSFAVN
ncbi:uncharacterized protein mthl15 isoform X3 [Linepithema humile]|uniref:uncharacterized protein mthl15 isoform X3 n=1 Tax=Linepithema humile TaxID=83485 RepID=UPI00351F0B15